MGRSTVLAAFVGAALATVACQFVVGLEPTPDAVGPDAAVPSAETGPRVPGAPDPCDPSTLGTHPLVGGDGPTLDLALAYIELDPTAHPERNDAGVELCPTVGFDLDERATCYDDAGNRAPARCGANDVRSCPFGPSCINPGAEPVCDAPLGIDNALGQVANAAFLGSFSGLSAADVVPNAALTTGTSNVLLRIAGYNGEADDSRVEIQLFGSTGLAATTMALPDAARDGGEQPWDQRSRREWYIDPETLHDDTSIPKAVGDGYVTGHVLVASVAQFPLPLGTQTNIIVDGVTLTAELRRSTGGFSLVRGRIGGYVTVARVLQTVLSLTFAVGDQVKPICGSDFEPLARAKGCGLADLARENDAGRCDAVSFGAAFAAVPAIIGDKLARRGITVACDASTECP